MRLTSVIPLILLANELDISSRGKEIKEIKELSSSIVETGLNVILLMLVAGFT